jgi:hypothetical protein
MFGTASVLSGVYLPSLPLKLYLFVVHSNIFQCIMTYQVVGYRKIVHSFVHTQ